MPQEGSNDPDALDSLLAVYLLDLRAQYEAEMRLLTEAHRQIERYRTGASEAKLQARASLLQNLNLLVTANTTIRDGLEEAINQVLRLGEPERS